MPWYLEHHFDPDFNHFELKPKEGKTGKVDHYNLGYVQNVVKGQLVAELRQVTDEEAAGLDSRYVYNTSALPVGPNCKIDPANKHCILAAANGYVFYNDGLITVKKMLNVRRDVDFHTGNVVFVNDIAVHGSVRTGFEVHGNNILVKGIIEGAKINARGALASETGVKGQKSALLRASQNIRLPFCENAELRTRSNVMIDTSCMHTDIYASGNVVIKERLQGGTIYTSGMVYVMEQLGGGQGTATQFIMGYDPFLFSKLRDVEENIKIYKTKVESLESLCAKSPEHREEFTPQKKDALEKLTALHRIRTSIWEKFDAEDVPSGCRILVPGKVRPGVEISIGKAYLKVNDYLENVRFCLENDEIVYHSPALEK
ncbi:FapA family protein [Oleidesulfovibrio sp.]|uniref:FapA family protein n=1 Tax=Oleidesulfovibrio sp. TaxID=2909707 RepID=UPI003A890DC9